MAKISTEDSNTQGGGYRNGPKRWNGNGHAPARHIPWPELFKHHQSVLIGHLKMMDMVRKHCAPGSGNFKTADACVNRTQELLRDFKKVSMSFVPPKDNIDQVPLGVSSESMYPGYSPADHEYGKAAEEFGTQVAEMKKKGVEWKPPADGPEYTVGQNHMSHKKKSEKNEKQSSKQKATSRTPSFGEPMEGIENTSEQSTQQQEPLWFVDSNPINANGASKEKRKASDDFQPKIKKAKASASNEDSTAPEIEQDDISAEVEARLRAKEERRKQKKQEKKRKRESNGSSIAAEEPARISSADESTLSRAKEIEKPKKKRQKSIDGEGLQPPPSGLASDPSSSTDQKEKKSHKKKNKRESLENAEDSSTNASADDSDKAKKKKLKKKRHDA